MKLKSSYDLPESVNITSPTSNSKITIYQEDILEVEDQRFSEFNFIIGNLPYYISTPILLKLAKIKKNDADLFFMLQKEVAERVSATPSTKMYGRLSSMLQYFINVFSMRRYLWDC